MKVKFKDPQGDLKATEIFIVTFIDHDDSEDSTSAIWIANDEHHLYDLVKASCVDEDDLMEQFMSDRFEEGWGMEILYTHIGSNLRK